jgi:hypothetical protein
VSAWRAISLDRSSLSALAPDGLCGESRMWPDDAAPCRLDPGGDNAEDAGKGEDDGGVEDLLADDGCYEGFEEDEEHQHGQTDEGVKRAAGGEEQEEGAQAHAGPDHKQPPDHERSGHPPFVSCMGAWGRKECLP